MSFHLYMHNGSVDRFHRLLVQTTDKFRKTALIDRADLFEQYDAFFCQPLRLNGYMRRKICFARTARDRCHDRRRAVPVPRIVLQDQDGAKAALLAPDDGIEFRIINIVSFYLFHLWSPDK